MNTAIREHAKEKDVRLWQLAKAMGISEFTLSRRLRDEFAPRDRDQAIALIDKIAKDREA